MASKEDRKAAQKMLTEANRLERQYRKDLKDGKITQEDMDGYMVELREIRAMGKAMYKGEMAETSVDQSEAEKQQEEILAQAREALLEIAEEEEILRNDYAKGKIDSVKYVDTVARIAKERLALNRLLYSLDRIPATGTKDKRNGTPVDTSYNEYWDSWGGIDYSSSSMGNPKGGPATSKGWAKSYAPACYESHPPLPLKDGLVIYGGSCRYPVVQDADVYVGFDSFMDDSIKAYPWEKGESFLFYIQDHNVPKSVEQTGKLVDYLIEQIEAGKKVHIGCIGGHGRTGMILAILVKKMLGIEDAVEYVRKNYCQKVVETDQQARWLTQHFGIKYAAGSQKSHFGFTGKQVHSSQATHLTKLK